MKSEQAIVNIDLTLRNIQFILIVVV